MLPLDPALPQLQTALNADAMRDIFRDTLTPIGNDSFDILDCRLSRFRYRQATRSIVLYDLCLREETTGQQRRQWVAGVTYPGNKARRLYRKLAGSTSAETLPAACLPFNPVSFIPELRMMVQLFPVDRYLPTLPALMAGARPEMEHLFLDQLGPDAWQIERCHVEPVRYRPFFGVTLCYIIDARDTDTGQHKTRRFYVKVYRGDDGKQAYQFLRTIERELSTCRRGFSTVKPIAYFEELHALVLAAAPGKSLEETLIDDDDVDGAITKTARALASLHQSKIGISRHRSRSDMIVRAQRAGTLIRWACPNLTAQVDEIIGTLQDGLKEVHPCPAHLDIKPEHIFLDGDRVILLDLDSCSGADPVYDPAMLLARLQALPNLLPVSRGRAWAAARALVEEYFSHVPDEWRDRFKLNYTSAALKVALYFLQHQEPGWRASVADFVSRAGDAAAGRT